MLTSYKCKNVTNKATTPMRFVLVSKLSFAFVYICECVCVAHIYIYIYIYI